MAAVADVAMCNTVLAVEHIVSRKAVDLPTTCYVGAPEQDRDIEFVTLSIGTDILGRLPVERDGNDLQVLRIPPATQPYQVIGADRADLAPGREEIDEHGSGCGFLEVV